MKKGMVKNPTGFKNVQNKIAAKVTPRKGETKQEAAGAILANATRNTSPAAKKANPALKKVKG